jgi:hypothetical protein
MPAAMDVASAGLDQVGALTRQEAETNIVGYAFDLRTNLLAAQTELNTSAGREHRFYAWRFPGGVQQPVAMRLPRAVLEEVANTVDEEDGAPYA